MGLDIERVVSTSLGREAEERFPQPSRWSSAGTLDRRHQDAHLVAMRDLRRGVEGRLSEIAGKMVTDLLQLDAQERILTETKFKIERQRKISLALGGEDPEMSAQFGILDAEFFQRSRSRLNGWY